MSKNLPTPAPDPSGEIILYQTDDGVARIEVRLESETVWLSQKAMAELFQKDVRTVNDHIRNIFEEGELRDSSVIRKYRITAADGKQYDTLHYNLDVKVVAGDPAATEARLLEALDGVEWEASREDFKERGRR
ncbi:MAG TPA: hypothetical protein VND64_31595 [Pirellulales bacterium]|nr:hypothetical protein [Pirellulales bacterium]